MPNNNVTAQCPFYEKENQTTIFCETIFEEEGMFSARIFRTAREKSEFMREHCARYPKMRCIYADYMNRIYTEAGEPSFPREKQERRYSK